MKRIRIAILMPCALVLILTACGGGGTSGAIEGNTLSNVTAVATTTVQPGGSTVNSTTVGTSVISTTIQFDADYIPVIDNSLKSVNVPIIPVVK